MNNLTEAEVTEYIPTIYTTPCTMTYVQNGCEQSGDIFAERNGIVVILYNTTRKVLIFVKQFRAAVYIHDVPAEDKQSKIDVAKYPADTAISLEFCAGLADKNLTLEELAVEEILEECGYSVPEASLEKVATIPNGTGTSGAQQTVFYCEVSDDMRVSSGGGVEGEEIIDVVELTVEELQRYLSQSYVCSPAMLLFGFYWFLENKMRRK